EVAGRLTGVVVRGGDVRARHLVPPLGSSRSAAPDCSVTVKSDSSFDGPQLATVRAAPPAPRGGPVAFRLTDVVRDHARDPELVALTFGGQSTTYAELERRAGRAATAMAADGIGVGA